MRIFVMGATGFIGRALVLRLRRDGHDVAAWARSPRNRDKLGAEVELVHAIGGDAELVRVLSRCDGVVNLAGAPIVGRWSASRKRTLAASRVGVTERLVRALEAASPRPRVLVSGSAIGYYGMDRGDETLTEESAPGSDFLAMLCREWETAANRAAPLGVRVVTLRTGIVLGRDGGALAYMLPLFRLGLGGPLGTGKQWMSFIHLHDLVEIIATALVDDRYEGPINGTAPKPVTNEVFADTLGRVLGRPARLPVPSVALRLVLGEAAEALLGGQRVIPRKLDDLGFRHAFPSIDSALADVAGDLPIEITRLPRGASVPTGSSYLASRPPKYLLTARTMLDVTPDQAFEFFARPENLGLMTPSSLDFHFEDVPTTMRQGSSLEARLHVAPHVRAKWGTRIEQLVPGVRFVDSQRRGPYRAWWHEHVFSPVGSRTLMEDRVYYALPLGILGAIAQRIFVARSLRNIFGYRSDAIRLRFGGAPG